MTTDQNFIQNITTAQSIEAILPYFDKIDSSDDEKCRTVIVNAFPALAELDDPDLHKRGLEISYELPFKERDWLHNFLNNWAKNLPAEKRQYVYDYWITSLAKTLEDVSNPDRLECAIRMVITIGIRTEEIQKQLERLAGINCMNDLPAIIQDQAINALAGLGYPDEDSLIDRMLQRLSSKDHSLLWLLPAVSRLTPRSLISIILQIYKEHRDDDGAYGSLLWVIADLALAYPEEADNIWKAIVEGITPQSIFSINMAGDVTSRIDSPLVLDYFLSKILCTTQEDNIGNTGTSPNYLIYNRMRNLSRPRQIEAYRRNNSSNLKQVIQGLRHDACRDTGKDTDWETVPMRLKKMAWDITLRLNMDEITDWFPEAMEDTNRFVQGDIAELAGFIRATSAIPSLRKCASRKEINFIPGMAVIHALGNIGTRESFDALMDCNIRIGNNDVSQDLPDSIAGATLFMNDCGPLLVSIENDTLDPLIRMACTAALEQVSSEHPGLVEPFTQRIITLLSHSDILPAHAAKFLLGSLGYLAINNDGAGILLQFAHKGGDEGTRALESLARWDILASHNDLLEVLGLKSEDNGWTLGKKPNERESFVIGLLYTKHSEEFSRAVVRILADSGYYEAIQVMGILMKIPHEIGDTDVMNALLKRIFDTYEKGSVEAAALEALASISPDTFVHELRYEISSKWNAPAREAVVSCIRRINKTNPVHEEAIETLRRFLTDAVPSIRRETAVVLSEKYMDQLVKEAEGLLNSSSADDRESGIQAACWIEEENSFQSMLTKARHDIAKNVRKAAFDGFNDRQDRRLANNYLDHVLSDGNDVLGVWHYGQALRDYGDGETSRRLVVASNNTAYTRNKRDWLRWIAKGVQKRWSELLQKRDDR